MTRLHPLLIVLPLLTGTSVSADDKPVTLDELVKEYERFELPMPPAGSKLVNYESGYSTDLVDGSRKVNYDYGFLVRPETRREPFARISQGLRYRSHQHTRYKVVPPVPESLADFQWADGNAVLFAIQCHHLGYKELAADRYRLYLERLARQSPADRDFETPMSFLHGVIRQYWEDELWYSRRDRKKIYETFRTINREFPPLNHGQIDPFLVRSLELTLAPRNANAGTIDAIVDELIDFHGGEKYASSTRVQDNPTVRKLLSHGFDAVPVLIDHLDDRRLTRLMAIHGFASSENLTIGNVCGILLEAISGTSFPLIKWLGDGQLNNPVEFSASPFSFSQGGFGYTGPQYRTALKRKAVEAWWNRIKAADEKSYLLTHVFKPQNEDNPKSVSLNRIVLIMLAERYPSELKGLYFKMLDDNLSLNYFDDHFAIELVNATLDIPRRDKETKRKILERGLTHREFRFRLDAEKALAKLDPEAYSRRLIRRIEEMPAGEPDEHYESYADNIIPLLNETNDPKAWAAMERAILHVPAVVKFRWVSHLGTDWGVNDQKHRKEKILALLACLDDRTAFPSDFEAKPGFGFSSPVKKLNVGNFAAMQLAPYFLNYIDDDEHRSDDEWAFFRKWLKEEVAKELK